MVEPFPHYFDACGFEEYEYETGDQVSICCPPEGGGMGPRRQVEPVCPPGSPRLLMETRNLSPRQHPRSACVGPDAHRAGL